MSLIEYFPKPLLSILYSCCNCGKRIPKETLFCESCQIQHIQPDEI